MEEENAEGPERVEKQDPHKGQAREWLGNKSLQY